MSVISLFFPESNSMNKHTYIHLAGELAFNHFTTNYVLLGWNIVHSETQYLQQCITKCVCNCERERTRKSRMKIDRIKDASKCKMQTIKIESSEALHRHFCLTKHEQRWKALRRMAIKASSRIILCYKLRQFLSLFSFSNRVNFECSVVSQMWEREIRKCNGNQIIFSGASVKIAHRREKEE